MAPRLKLKVKKLPPGKLIALRDRRDRQIKMADRGKILESDTKRLEALNLRIKEHKTVPEIAEILGVSVSQAYNYITEFWGPLIENIVEFQAQIIGDAFNDIEIIKQQLRPYIVDSNVKIAGVNKKGEFVEVERWRAMNAATDRLLKTIELQAKIAGVIKLPKSGEGEGEGKRTISEDTILKLADHFSKQHQEKVANAKTV